MAVRPLDETSPLPYIHAANHAVIQELASLEPEAMVHSLKRYDYIKSIADSAETLTVSQLKSMLLAPYPNGLCCRFYQDFFGTTKSMIDPKYGYEVFPGCCHMIPNHAMVIAAILLGGDDFQKSISIASSAAWDTDCNAGNVGAFNGIRLGLDGINAGADFRTPVADRSHV